MADHKASTMATDIPIYFFHPGLPWERGSNETPTAGSGETFPKQ